MVSLSKEWSLSTRVFKVRELGYLKREIQYLRKEVLKNAHDREYLAFCFARIAQKHALAKHLMRAI